MKNAILLFIIIAFSSCSKDDNGSVLKLPEVTEVGANTFGCYINGFLLIPREAYKLSYNQNGVPSGKGIRMEGDYYNADNSFSWRQFTVYNYKNRNNYYSIEFKLPNFPSMPIGTYDWGTSVYENEIVVNVYYINIETNEHQFYTSHDLSGKLIVTKKDNVSHTFSGTFFGTIKNQDGTKEIEIKDGRFDMNLMTINNHFFP